MTGRPFVFKFTASEVILRNVHVIFDQFWIVEVRQSKSGSTFSKWNWNVFFDFHEGAAIESTVDKMTVENNFLILYCFDVFTTPKVTVFPKPCIELYFAIFGVDILFLDQKTKPIKSFN